ncbi:unnamed protein product, partial [Mesorhabditis belari]|uniref:tRNA-t(6)A37 methylthiotransferase n=1 Tax=Mesorhabditis belari TaxID=2138241 RepID=A0AAF3F5B6_9BILA
MVDIEDGYGDLPGVAGKLTEDVTIRIRSTKKAPVHEEKGHMDSFVPGTCSVWMRTWGCSHNSSDSEYMAGILMRDGYRVTQDKDNADVWVLNSCTVKTPSEQQASNLVTEGQKSGKKIVMAGCVSQAAPNEKWLQGVSIVGVKQIDRITEIVEETVKGNTVRLLSRRRPDAGLALPKMRKNELVEVLAINTGCLNNCTYCKTKLARGDLKSYPIKELVEQAQTAFERDGVKELWLTSEDLGAYGRDIGVVLPDLLDELVKIIPDGCMMRLGMTNPPYILDYLEEIATILRHPRVYAFLHIPVQAGSDAVLRDMKREYTSDHFRKIVDYMKKNVPGIYIATDMICAFPTETEEDFEESMQLVRDYQFPSLFINQFFPRSGTPAARMKRVDPVEAKRRTAEMSRLFRSYSRYEESRVGEVMDVLVCELASDKLHAVGHNKNYEHVLVPDPGEVMGKWVKVRIVGVSKFHMLGERIAADEKNQSSATSVPTSTASLGSTLFRPLPIFVCIMAALLMFVIFELLPSLF